MGNLMKDAPATRYALLDRSRPDIQEPQPSAWPGKNINSTSAIARQPVRQLAAYPEYPRKYRSTVEELEAYIRFAYRR